MNLVRSIQDVAWRVRRSWDLLKVYWDTEDCDWSTIAQLMRHQIHRTRLHVEKQHIVVGSGRMARQMLIAETLLTRMVDEPYYEIATVRYPKMGKPWAKLITDLERQDDEMLATLLRKHLRTWWD